MAASSQHTACACPRSQPDTMDLFTEIDSVRVRYRDAGSGDPVLVLHGWGASIDAIQSVTSDLSRSFRAIAIDMPGHGQSPLPPKPWAVSDYMNLVLGFMAKMNIASAHMVGHSFGGRITIKLAAEHPEKVEKIVLVDAAGVPPPRKPVYYVKRGIARSAKLVAAVAGPPGRWLKDKIYSRIQSKDYAAAGPLRETFVKIVSEDLRPFLPRIKAPALLVWGRNDHDTPVSSGETMHRLIQGSELIVLDNAGHYSYADQFNAFRLRVNKFLRSDHPNGHLS